jgi:hypothetical protein
VKTANEKEGSVEMIEPDRDQQIIELISSKITEENTDSGWAVAYATMRALLVLKEIVEKLSAINEAIAPDNKAIGGQIERLVDFVRGGSQ